MPKYLPATYSSFLAFPDRVNGPRGQGPGGSLGGHEEQEEDVEHCKIAECYPSHQMCHSIKVTGMPEQSLYFIQLAGGYCC